MEREMRLGGWEVVRVIKEHAGAPRAVLFNAALMMGAATTGCGTPGGEASDNERVGVIAQAITNSPATVMSFDEAGFWQPTSGTVASSDIHIEGMHSLAVSGGGWREIWSAPMTKPAVLSGTLAYDIRLPADQSNPW